ncbi:MAG: ribonuclease J [Alphaproteobacteria bacterium]|nr:ribonuclease J [Alphaproteobacteria bacterium]
MKKEKTAQLVFAALGGVGEIGMNMALYGFGPANDRRWLIVDCGVTFAGPHLPGIDLIMPDTRFIEAHADRIAGLVLTHAHEDHYGALLDLWPALDCPVFATRFAKAMVDAKARGNGFSSSVPIKVVKPGERFVAGPFELELVPMAHSIPQSCGVLISTEAGHALHTGDWKIDADPVGGWATDETRLRRIGKHCRPLALIADSTNATRDGASPSESEVAANLTKLIKDAPHRVAVTIFASNVGRMISIARAAQAAGRQVVASGRAVHRISEIAREQGMLDGIDEFFDQDAFSSLPRNKVLLLCTGSQGEARAAMARIARKTHPVIELSPGDQVIFSSRAIPGNEREINDIHNALVDSGVKVITDRDELVHVSGHPRRHEMRQLYDWTRPDVLVPVHGEAVHLKAHCDLGAELKIAEILPARNGDLVSLFPSQGVARAEIPAGRSYLDGYILCDPADSGVSERRKLSLGGHVTVSLCVNAKGRMEGGLKISVIGLPRIEDDEDFDPHATIRTAVAGVIKGLNRRTRGDAERLAEAIRRAVRGELYAIWGNKPMVTIFVHEARTGT